MTPEQQRIAIAKACGWTKFTPDTIQYTARRPDGKWGEIPDYLNDLNAMHEAEKILTDAQWLLYVRSLTNWCDTDPRPNWWRMRHAASATAAQRAEAFLKTLNLWKP